MTKIKQEIVEVSGPLVEPVSLSEVLSQARIDTTTSDQNSLISDIYIPTARQYLEHRTGRTFHEKTLQWLLSGFPDFGEPVKLLYATKLIEITGVVYLDSPGNSIPWPSANYIADTFSRVGRLVPAYNVPYPTPILYPVWPVRISGRAGIATTSPLTDAPSIVKQATVLLVAGMWENRESETIPDRAVMKTISLTYGVEALIAEMQREYVF